MKSSQVVIALSALVLMAGCGGGERSSESGYVLSGAVKLDGSSTVFPISEAVAEEFQKIHPRVRVTVGISGTGGGFKKFCVGDIDINDASRTIKDKEIVKAGEHGIEYIELPVAFDGISVVAHPENGFIDNLTTDELKKIWQPGSTVKNWSDVRAEWPDQEVALYGPGTDSGTFDYFTEAINGESQSCRADFTASEDDNVLVQGVSGDPGSLGFFGFAYYAENQDKLKAVLIDGGSGPVAPTATSINDGSYSPLSRPIFIYVSKAAAAKPEVREFVRFYLANAPKLAAEVGYVALPTRAYELALERFEAGVTGSAFRGRETIGVSIEKLLEATS